MAVLAGAFWLFGAGLEFYFNARSDVSFLIVLALPVIETVRAAGSASGEIAWMLAVGTFLLSAIWFFLASLLYVRAFDAFLAGLLVFEVFWIARWTSTFAAVKFWPIPSELSLWQQLMIGSASVLCGALLFAGILRPLGPRPFRRTVVLRSASFSQRRRQRSRFLGGVLMLAAAVAAASAPFLAFGDTEFGLEPVSMPIIFLGANIIYFIGKKFWRR